MPPDPYVIITTVTVHKQTTFTVISRCSKQSSARLIGPLTYAGSPALLWNVAHRLDF